MSRPPSLARHRPGHPPHEQTRDDVHDDRHHQQHEPEGDEARCLDADGRLAANWADSDETAESGWVNIENTGVLDNGSGAAAPNDRLHIMLLGEGECLVDDVQVIRIRLTDFLTNGSNLDLANITSLRLSFGGAAGSPQGRIGLDDIRLSPP